MATKKFTHKSDAEILTDLQGISSSITAFAWVSDEANITYGAEPSELEWAKIGGYCARQAHCEWVTV